MAPVVPINSAGATAASEIARYLRNETPPRRGTIDRRKVARRTHKDYVHPRVDGAWRIKYDRLRENLTTGFHTPCHKPYATVGEIHLNPKQLVGAGLSDYIDTTDAFWKPICRGAALTKQVLCELLPKKETLDSQDGSVQRLVPVDDGVNNGSAYIRKTLKDWETAITAVKSGRGFENFFKEREKEKEEAARSLTGQKELLLMSPPRKAHWTAATKNIKRMSNAMGNTQEDVELRMREIKQIAFLEKLEMVDKLLTILHVMRSKDLKSRQALAYDYLKQLMGKDIPLDTAGRPIFSRAPRPVAPTGAGFAHMLLESAPSSETISSGGHCPLKYHVSSTSVSRTKSSSLTSPSTTTGGFGALGPRYPIHRQGGPRVVGDRFDTWEDFIAIPDRPCPRMSLLGQRRLTQHQMPAFSQYSYGQGRSSKRSQDTDRVPIWQHLPILCGKAQKRPAHSKLLPITTELTPASGVTASDSVENIAGEMKKEFDRVREKWRRTLVSDIAKINREKYIVYHKKFHGLQLGHLMERNFEQMREDARDLEVDSEEVDRPMLDGDETGDEVSTGKWFLNLKHECDCVLGDGSREGSKFLKKIARFSLEDIHSIPKSKEKICLIVMSLPAYQILRPAIQKAAKFVLEDFLEMPTDAFSIFMSYRKLPVVI